MPTKLDISNKSHVYGWAVMVDFTLGGSGGFVGLGECKASLLWSRDLILTLEPRKVHPNVEAAGTKGFRMRLEAVDTAAEAEQLGLRLARAILSIAIQRNWGLSLSWPDQPLPCRVIDRTASRGVTVEAFATVSNQLDAFALVNAIDKELDQDTDYRVLLSMELCAASRLESDNRAKVIMLVSAFEALASQADLSAEIGPTIDNFVSEVNATEIDGGIKRSLVGQLRNLKRESVRKAIQRLMEQVGLDADDRHFVEEAYSVRSKIVHEAKRVPELDPMASRLDGILKRIYADLLTDS